MYSTLFWLFAVIGFVAQILCCVMGKNRLIRFVPMGVIALIMAATLILGVLAGSFGLIAALVLLWQEVKVLAVTALGYGLWALVNYAKK